MAGYTDSDRVLALGGLFQAARLARDIARDGICDAQAFAAGVRSLFAFDADSVAAVFDGANGVVHGIRTLLNQIESPSQRDLEISRYVVAMMHLGDRLMAGRHNMRSLHDDLVALQRRHENFELAENTQFEQLAQIYQDRISPLGPRIMIRGEPLHLQNPGNAARIRVALLAGVRASVLWRQTGGKKWQLLLRRRRIAAIARELVDNIAS